MKIKVLKGFNDLKEGVKRKPGDILEVSEKRAEEIAETLKKFGKGHWIEEVQEEPIEEVAKEEPKKTTTRRKKQG